MQNLIARSSRYSGVDYSYTYDGPVLTTEEKDSHEKDRDLNKILAISFSYDKAGTSFLSGNTWPGGIYVHFSPAIQEKQNGKPYMTRTCLSFGTKGYENDGFKIRLIPLDRGNPRRLEQVAEFFDALVPELGELWFTKGYTESHDRLKDACMSFQQNHKLGSTMIWPKKEVQPEAPILEAAAG